MRELRPCVSTGTWLLRRSYLYKCSDNVFSDSRRFFYFSDFLVGDNRLHIFYNGRSCRNRTRQLFPMEPKLLARAQLFGPQAGSHLEFTIKPQTRSSVLVPQPPRHSYCIRFLFAYFCG